MGGVEQTFIQLKEKLKQRVGEASFSSWLSSLAFQNFSEGCLTLSVPSKFSADYIKRNFQKDLFALFHESFSDINELTIAVQKTKTISSVESKPTTLISAKTLPANTNHTEPEWYIQSLLNDRYTFENFIVGEANHFAHAAARKIASTDEKLFNPYFLYAGVGLGKTHLLHAIAHEIQNNNPKRRVMYTSIQRFFDSYVRMLKQNQAYKFKEQFQNIDILIVDDFQFIDGKKAFQQEFLYILNSFVEQGKQIIVASNRPPNVLGLSPALKSRLISGLVADIGTPCPELRMNILQAKSSLLGATVPKTILDFLADVLPHNVRELEAGLRRVLTYADLTGRAMHLKDVKHAIKDLISVSSNTITLGDIVAKTCQFLGVRESEISSKQRTKRVVYARRITMYLTTRLTDLSYSEIGRKLGGKDHSTILYAIRAIDKTQKTTPQLFDDIQAIETILKT